MFARKRNWLAYEDGSYEQVDPSGNLNLKKRGPDREDWWVVQKDQGWSPPRGKQRPLNVPSKARTTRQRSQSILSNGMAAASGKQAPAKRVESFREGEWDWLEKGLGQASPKKSTKKNPLSPALPGGLGVFNQDPMGDKESKGTQGNPGKTQSILSGLFNPDPGIIAKPIANTVPFTRDMIKYLDDQSDHSVDPRRNQDAPRKFAHAAARLTPVTAKEKPKVRLLDQGLDPEVAMVKDKGETTPARNPYQDARDMEEQTKPKEHNPNQTAREMEETANAPRSSAKDAREMKSRDKVVRKVPRPAPDEFMGSPEYYRWWAEEFKLRYPDKEPPDYLMEYGYKYAKIFQEEIRPELSLDGKLWVDKTMLGLQERLEQAYKDGMLDEMDPEAFAKFAFDSHVTEYTDKEFGALDYDDQVFIAERLGQEEDFFTPASIGVMVRMVPHMAVHAKEKRGKVGDALMDWWAMVRCLCGK